MLKILVIVWFSKLTSFAVHWAYNTVAFGTTFDPLTCEFASNCVPLPSAFVFHPSNVYPVAVIADAAFVSSVYFIITCDGAVPCSFALYDNIAVFSFQTAYNVINGAFSIIQSSDISLYMLNSGVIAFGLLLHPSNVYPVLLQPKNSFSLYVYPGQISPFLYPNLFPLSPYTKVWFHVSLVPSFFSNVTSIFGFTVTSNVVSFPSYFTVIVCVPTLFLSYPVTLTPFAPVSIVFVITFGSVTVLFKSLSQVTILSLYSTVIFPPLKSKSSPTVYVVFIGWFFTDILSVLGLKSIKFPVSAFVYWFTV